MCAYADLHVNSKNLASLPCEARGASAGLARLVVFRRAVEDEQNAAGAAATMRWAPMATCARMTHSHIHIHINLHTPHKRSPVMPAFQQLLDQQQAQTVEMVGGLHEHFQVATHSVLPGVKGEGTGGCNGDSLKAFPNPSCSKESRTCMPGATRSSSGTCERRACAVWRGAEPVDH